MIQLEDYFTPAQLARLPLQKTDVGDPGCFPMDFGARIVTVKLSAIVQQDDPLPVPPRLITEARIRFPEDARIVTGSENGD